MMGLLIPPQTSAKERKACRACVTIRIAQRWAQMCKSVNKCWKEHYEPLTRHSDTEAWSVPQQIIKILSPAPGSRQPEELLLISKPRCPCLKDGQDDNLTEEGELLFHQTPAPVKWWWAGYTHKGEDVWLTGGWQRASRSTILGSLRLA